MKLFSNKTLLVLLLLLSGFGYITSCTHENDPLPAPASNTVVINRGDAVLLPGTMTKGDTTQWKLDKAHSSVLWQTNYVGEAGLLTGRFNQFGMNNVTDAEMQKYYTSGQPLPDTSWAFYESDPSKIYFSGYVQMNQVNTGEPARDGGCLLSSFGAPAIEAGAQNLDLNNIARIKTTKVEFDPLSEDYIVTLNLTWQGPSSAPLTESIVGKLKYVKRATVNAGTTSEYSVFGLQLTFQFNCRDFGVTSTSVSDKVQIECNMNFNNK